MVNKRGWLRIIEAFVSILIVFGTVMTISMSNKETADGSLCATLTPLLDEIAQQEELRIAVLTNDGAKIDIFLETRIKNPSIKPEVKICKACLDGVSCTTGEQICTHSQSGIDYKEICAGERVISDSVPRAATSGGASQPYQPQKLKIFLFKI